MTESKLKELILTGETFAIGSEVGINYRYSELKWFNGLQRRLVAHIYGLPLHDEIIIYPASWWDAVKDAFIPNVFKKYIPINYKRIHIKASELATKLEVPKQYGPLPIMYRKDSSFNSTDNE